MLEVDHGSHELKIALAFSFFEFTLKSFSEGRLLTYHARLEEGLK